MKAASSETDSPLRLVTTSFCAPAARLGVVKVSVFMSLKVTDTVFLPRASAAPGWKPLPRSVTLVPPATGPFTGSSEPIPSGALASCNTDAGGSQSEESLAVFVNHEKLPCWPSASVESMANGSGRKMRRRREPVRASRISMPPVRFVAGGSAGAGPVRNGT